MAFERLPSSACLGSGGVELMNLDALANAMDPDYQALVAEILTPEYLAELECRYPVVRRVGVVTEAVVDAEIARLRRKVEER
jgi:hypothetical protein